MFKIISISLKFILTLMLFYTLLKAFKRQRQNHLKLITIYIIVSFFFNAIDILLWFLKDQHDNFQSKMYSIFDLFELSVLNSYLFSNLKSLKFRITAVLCSLSYFSLCAIAWYQFPQRLFDYSPLLQGIECIFIAIPSLLLLFEILKSDLATDLPSNPAFLISSALLFYFSIGVPTSFFYGLPWFINNVPNISIYLISITSVFYGVLIYMFIRAFLCSVVKTTG
jgi:hypothetical protein